MRLYTEDQMRVVFGAGVPAAVHSEIKRGMVDEFLATLTPVDVREWLGEVLTEAFLAGIEHQTDEISMGADGIASAVDELIALALAALKETR